MPEEDLSWLPDQPERPKEDLSWLPDQPSPLPKRKSIAKEILGKEHEITTQFLTGLASFNPNTRRNVIAAIERGENLNDLETLKNTLTEGIKDVNTAATARVAIDELVGTFGLLKPSTWAAFIGGGAVARPLLRPLIRARPVQRVIREELPTLGRRLIVPEKPVVSPVEARPPIPEVRPPITPPIRKELPTALEVAKRGIPPKGRLAVGEIIPVEKSLISPPKPVMPTLVPTLGERESLRQQVNIAQSAAEAVIRNPESKIVQDTSKRLFKRVADALGAGELTPQDLPQVLKKYNLAPQEFAAMYVNELSTFGKGLNIMSQLAKQIGKIIPEVGEELAKKPLEPDSAFDIAMNVYRKVDSVRRASMVGQLATAARNAISQGARYTLNIFDDTLEGLGKTLTRRDTIKDSFRPAFEDVAAIMRRLSQPNRLKLEQLLEKYPIEKAQLLSAPILDVSMGSKYARMVNIFNRAQEYFFRKMVFDARVSAETARIGINPFTTAEIPQEILSKAIKDALEITFAKYPEGKLGKGMMRAYRDFPFLTIAHPFPRFWANSIKFLWDFSPAGFGKIMLPSVRKQIAQGNMKALSRATLGTMLWGAAYAIRSNPQWAGEKWYEIKLDSGKRLDTRAFAPFVQYMFIAETMLNPEKLTGRDWADGALSINRIAGTGLTLLDWLRSPDTNTGIKRIKDFVGDYLQGFTVPFRTWSDIIGQFAPEERIVRTTRERPIIGPVIEPIPFVRRTLPIAPRITRAEPFEREAPLLRQLTGLTIKTKTRLEQEIDRLGIEYLYPRTGDKTLDRLITKRAGRLVGIEGMYLLSTPEYTNADDETRRQMIKDLVSKHKRQGKSEVQIPYTILKLRKMKTREEQLKELQTMLKKRKISNNSMNWLLDNKEMWIKE